MIRVEKNSDVPAGLTSANARSTRDRLLREGKNHRVSDHLYRHDSVLTALRELYYGKCAYCETKIEPGSSPRVDHYRPHAIYYWLAYEWSNLVLSCERCNRKKSDRFPVQGERVVQPQADFKAWSAGSVDFLAERALLLHPEWDEPAEHLTFHPDGTIRARAGSVRGEETIRVCGLDREELTIERKKVVDRFRRRLRDSLVRWFRRNEQHPEQSDEECERILCEELDSVLTSVRNAREPHRPYSRLGWHLGEEFRQFLLVNLPANLRLVVWNAYWRQVL
ncbi:MAG: TIGR02646 family protein [Magnetococcales bacterium]|nr:TIGR02646 family protein [Magnetococcales bacterium]